MLFAGQSAATIRRPAGATLTRDRAVCIPRMCPFVTCAKTLGKPVNFVPVIDQDVRRWWRGDSLWQARDTPAPTPIRCPSFQAPRR